MSWYRAPVEALLDFSVAGSFGSPGFRLRAKDWDPPNAGILGGKFAMVTGGATGIGRAAALELARLGATVSIVARTEERGADTLRELQSISEAPHRVLAADLSSIEEIDALCNKVTKEGKAIDYLLNIAGTAQKHRTENSQGVEMTFAVNVLAPFSLTLGLEPVLRKSVDGRVIFASSGGAYLAHLEVRDPEFKQRRYGDLLAYSESKRALIVLAKLFSLRWKNSSLTSASFHPGWVDTPLVKSGMPVFERIFRPILRTPSQGADTAVWLCWAEPPLGTPGLFWFDRKARRTSAGLKDPSDAECARFWEYCFKRRSYRIQPRQEYAPMKPSAE